MKVRVLGCVCLCLLLLGRIVSAGASQELVRAKIGIKLRSGDEEHLAKVRERVTTGDQLQIYVIPEPDPAYIYVIHNDQRVVRLLNPQNQIEIVNHFLLRLPETADDSIFYEFDGESSLEDITIICSSEALPEINQILNSQEGAFEKWLAFEQKLIEQSRVELGDEVSTTWTIGGTVRGGLFKLTEQSFENLKSEDISESILAALQSLKNQGFWDEESFLNAVEGKIGKEQVVQYRELILKYADQRKVVKGEDTDPFLEKLQISSGKSLIVKKYEFRVKK